MQIGRIFCDGLVALSEGTGWRMAFQIGKEVRIRNTKHVFGKIASTIDDQYLVDIEPRKLRLRASDIEEIDQPEPKSNEPTLIESERWLALAMAARLLEEWGGNLETDTIPEEIRILLRKALSLK